jgi:signal transduction histidine kinase
MSMSPALDLPRASPIDAEAPMRAASPQPNLFAQPLVPILTAVAVAALVVAAILFARTSGYVCALWGASGVAAAVWMRTGGRGVAYEAPFGALMAIGVLAGELLAGNLPMLALVFTVANMLEIVLVVVLARRFMVGLRLDSVQNVARFLLCAAIAPLPAGLLASGVLSVTDGQDFLNGFRTWWFGHALGFAVIGALGLAITHRALRDLRRPILMAETVLILCVLTAVCCVIFAGVKIPLGFILLPLLLATAVRLKVLGTAVALTVISLCAVGGAMAGHGPYTTGFSQPHQALMAQMLVLFGYLPFLFVAALLEERNAYAERAHAGQVRAEQASEAKSRLLANVAHEIKSPVGGVIGIGDLWRTGQLGPVTDTQAEMAEMLVKTARQIEALSLDLLDVARAESGAVKVELRPTDVPGLLEDVRRAIALRPEAKSLWLEVATDGDGLTAMADSQRLVQVVSNLASNAVKYGGSGGSVVFKCRRVQDRVRLEVVDRGPGLTLEKQAQLFEPFNRLGLERSTIEGHGVGLALAKRLVELQHGSIGVQSRPGEGAIFWVELPAA